MGEKCNFFFYFTLRKNRRRQKESKVINKPKIIKTVFVCWWRFVNVNDELVMINFGKIGSCGGGIRR